MNTDLNFLVIRFENEMIKRINNNEMLMAIAGSVLRILVRSRMKKPNSEKRTEVARLISLAIHVAPQLFEYPCLRETMTVLTTS